MSFFAVATPDAKSEPMGAAYFLAVSYMSLQDVVKKQQ